MAPDKLSQLLKKLEVPEPDSRAVVLAREKARLAFQHREAFKADLPKRSFFWTWGLASLTSAALAVLLIMVRSDTTSLVSQGGAAIAPQISHGIEMVAWELGLRRDAKIIREMGNLFPEDLKAVIEAGGTQEVVLGGSSQQSQPVAVELRKEGESIRVLSFSGQTLEVKIGGKAFKMEILLTPKDEVLLSGDSFAVKSEKGKEINVEGIQVRAAPI